MQQIAHGLGVRTLEMLMREQNTASWHYFHVTDEQTGEVRQLVQRSVSVGSRSQFDLALALEEGRTYFMRVFLCSDPLSDAMNGIMEANMVKVNADAAKTALEEYITGNEITLEVYRGRLFATDDSGELGADPTDQYVVQSTESNEWKAVATP